MNRLLAMLSIGDRERLLRDCLCVDLKYSEVLANPNDPIRNVYFPIDSAISLVVPVAGEDGLEVGLVGSEGMVGMCLMLGVGIEPFLAVVQGAGQSFRMTAPSFLRQLEAIPALQKALERYLYVSMNQIAQTAACSHFHRVEARLARWLLMTHDRAHSDTFHVTHVFLAYMLGVRRVGITKAANSLQVRKLISYHRGDVTILDRAGLELASCECYRAGTDSYRRTLG